jgi:hypothetical protein
VIAAVTTPTRPKLDTLEDASADLDTARAFAAAAERLLSDIKGWVRFRQLPDAKHLIDLINDCDTLMAEARSKAAGARKIIDAFHLAEFEYQRAERENEVRNGK